MKSKAYFTNRIIDFALHCLFIPNLFAHPSLFFTAQELHLIHENIFLQTGLKEPDKNSHSLLLSDIIYVDKDHWTLWLNNQIVHEDAPPHVDGFQIEKVTSRKVEFSWIPPQSTAPIRFTLLPHQRYLGKENRVMLDH